MSVNRLYFLRRMTLRLGNKSDIEEMISLRSELFSLNGTQSASSDDVGAFRHFYEKVWNEENPIYVVVEKEDRSGLIGTLSVP